MFRCKNRGRITGADVGANDFNVSSVSRPAWQELDGGAQSEAA